MPATRFLPAALQIEENMSIPRNRSIHLVPSLPATRLPTYHLRNVELLNDVLVLSVAYTGGCAEHDFELLASSASVPDASPSVELALLHDPRGDACKALMEEELHFDLSPLHELWAPSLRRGALLKLQIGGRHLLYKL
jgi:hypothetical protein